MALRMTSCLLLLSCERDKTSEREKPQTTSSTPARHQPDRHPAVLQIQAEKGEQSKVKTREVNNKEK